MNISRVNHLSKQMDELWVVCGFVFFFCYAENGVMLLVDKQE